MEDELGGAMRALLGVREPRHGAGSVEKTTILMSEVTFPKDHSRRGNVGRFERVGLIVGFYLFVKSELESRVRTI